MPTMIRPSVQPVDTDMAALPDPAVPPPGEVRVNDMPLTPGTGASCLVRVLQAAVAVCTIAAGATSTKILSFRYLFSTAVCQLICSVLLFSIETYARHVKRRLRNVVAVRLFAVVDAINAVLTVTAAGAATGMACYVSVNANYCLQYNCRRLWLSALSGVVGWAAILPTLVVSLWLGCA